MNGDAAILEAYSNYFARFVEGYAEQGIDVEVVAPQNEPGFEQNYPSCLWDGTTFKNFIAQYLGPKMQELGVKVMLGTLSNTSDAAIGQAVTGDATAKSFVSFAGVQWGMLDSVNAGSGEGGLPIWATEHMCGNYPWKTGYVGNQAPNDQAYAVES
jgi:glucosylceramidase